MQRGHSYSEEQHLLSIYPFRSGRGGQGWIEWKWLNPYHKLKFTGEETQVTQVSQTLFYTVCFLRLCVQPPSVFVSSQCTDIANCRLEFTLSSSSIAHNQYSIATIVLDIINSLEVVSRTHEYRQEELGVQNQLKIHKTKIWECRLMAEYFPSVVKVQNSIPSTTTSGEGLYEKTCIGYIQIYNILCEGDL